MILKLFKLHLCLFVLFARLCDAAGRGKAPGFPRERFGAMAEATKATANYPPLGPNSANPVPVAFGSGKPEPSGDGQGTGKNPWGAFKFNGDPHVSTNPSSSQQNLMKRPRTQEIANPANTSSPNNIDHKEPVELKPSSSSNGNKSNEPEVKSASTTTKPSLSRPLNGRGKSISTERNTANSKNNANHNDKSRNGRPTGNSEDSAHGAKRMDIGKAQSFSCDLTSTIDPSILQAANPRAFNQSKKVANQGNAKGKQVQNAASNGNNASIPKQRRPATVSQDKKVDVSESDRLVHDSSISSIVSSDPVAAPGPVFSPEPEQSVPSKPDVSPEPLICTEPIVTHEPVISSDSVGSSEQSIPFEPSNLPVPDVSSTASTSEPPVDSLNTNANEGSISFAAISAESSEQNILEDPSSALWQAFGLEVISFLSAHDSFYYSLDEFLSRDMIDMKFPRQRYEKSIRKLSLQFSLWLENEPYASFYKSVGDRLVFFRYYLGLRQAEILATDDTFSEMQTFQGYCEKQFIQGICLGISNKYSKNELFQTCNDLVRLEYGYDSQKFLDFIANITFAFDMVAAFQEPDYEDDETGLNAILDLLSKLIVFLDKFVDSDKDAIAAWLVDESNTQ